MIFAVNTSTKQFGVALMHEDGTIQAEYSISSGSKNFTGFMPAIHSLFTSSHTDVREVKGLIVAIGPGSFTGLRVGLAMAKGMAHGRHLGIIGVSSLEAMASQLPFISSPICAMIDSRKGEVFAALFRWGKDDQIVRIREDTSLKITDLASIIEGPTLFLGTDFKNHGCLIKKALGPQALLAPAHLWGLKASSVGSLGLKRFLANDFDDIQDLIPRYLRPPDIRSNPYPLLSTEKEHQVVGS
jgi:tRNA threonylcarbamoyladenosine biosynthesis protein TsaB